MAEENQFPPVTDTSGDAPPAASGKKDRNLGPDWERGVLEKLTFSALKEQRAGRRWGIFFKLLTFAYLTAILLYVFDFGLTGTGKAAALRHTALVNLEGEIDSDGAASAEKINSALNNAFRDAATAGVILRINSPGGSPVQAGMINDEMRRLRAEFPQVPLYVVVEEICASAAYYIAAGSDKVFVDKASLVGSIGVLMNGFGVTGTMEKLGVERRLQTAGRNKAIGDPFSPVSPEQKQHIQGMLDEIHQQFIAVVRDGRGDRLKETPEMFSGLFWSGVKSIDLGLADGLGTVDSVARDVVKAEDLVDYTEKENLAERVAKRFGAALSSGAVSAFGKNFGLR